MGSKQATAAKANAQTSGKGMQLGKGKRRWSQAATHSSYYEPYPFDLQFCVVDGIYFSWGEMADKFGAASEKIGDYSVATIQGKPPASIAADLRAQAEMPPPAQAPVSRQVYCSKGQVWKGLLKSCWCSLIFQTRPKRLLVQWWMDRHEQPQCKASRALCCEGCVAHRPFEILCSVAAPSNLLLSACLSHTFEFSEVSGRLHHNAFCSNALNAGLYNTPLPPPQVEGVDSVFQEVLNKVMNIQNGNTTLRLQEIEEGIAGFVQLNLCQLIQSNQDLITSFPQCSRTYLLQYRPPKQTSAFEGFQLPIPTTTQFQGSAHKAKAIARTGKRTSVKRSDGNYSHYKKRPSKRQSRIRELGKEFISRTPPPEARRVLL